MHFAVPPGQQQIGGPDAGVLRRVEEAFYQDLSDLIRMAGYDGLDAPSFFVQFHGLPKGFHQGGGHGGGGS